MATQGDSVKPLQLSQFVHRIPLSDERVLCLHAITGAKLVVDAKMDAILSHFALPQPLIDSVAYLSGRLAYSSAEVEVCIDNLIEREFLSALSSSAELDAASTHFSNTYGRNPLALLDRYRRKHAEGSFEYWAVGIPRSPSDFNGLKSKFRVVLLGDCDVNVEAEFMRREGERRGMDLRVVASQRNDDRLLLETPHDAVVVGALPSRYAIDNTTAKSAPTSHPVDLLLGEATSTLQRLRLATKAPILLNNYPVPTIEPLGLADRGLNSHRNCFRRINLRLEELASELPGVYIADVEAALSAAGKSALLDDSLVSFTHLGSLGWMLQRAESERAAVHNLFPELVPLADRVRGDPYLMESIVARMHVDMLQSLWGADQKKCVIVDLDGTLWPGVLAETGSPFAWRPEVSGPFSFVGLYFGLHEALRTLIRRGILVAAVSKNEFETVRTLWHFDAHYPHDRLLHLNDLVTSRINWDDKVTNITSIACELGFPLNTFVFIDDNPVERERVRRFLPEVLVIGDNPFELREWLLSDPRLQPSSITFESSLRSTSTRHQIQRRALRQTAANEIEFRRSLDIRWQVTRVRRADDLLRVKELFDRTTQFNTTGRRFHLAELADILQFGYIFTMRLTDTFGDYGIVGACVVEEGIIHALAVSCRALGFDIEHHFVEHILLELSRDMPDVLASLTPTPRNLPVRNLYKDHGFRLCTDGLWHVELTTHSSERRSETVSPKGC